MLESNVHDAWSSGDSYELYMGRWSRQIAALFLDWLAAPTGLDWLDVGCGTGALTQTILERRSPHTVTGIDASEGFIDHARRTTSDARAKFEVGSADALPLDDESFDAAVSGLVLNFVPDCENALAEMRRVVKPKGLIAFYVWDYPGGGLGFLNRFWKVATRLDADAEGFAEDKRFPFCTRDGLEKLCLSAGLEGAEIVPIEVPTVFETFEDYWRPFTLGAGPAPGYVAGLDDAMRNALHDALEADLGAGRIDLVARAWAVQDVRR